LQILQSSTKVIMFIMYAYWSLIRISYINYMYFPTSLVASPSETEGLQQNSYGQVEEPASSTLVEIDTLIGTGRTLMLLKL